MTVPLDRIDAVILTGLGLIAFGLFHVSLAVGWIFVGLVLVALAVILGRPPTTRPPSASTRAA